MSDIQASEPMNCPTGSALEAYSELFENQDTSNSAAKRKKSRFLMVALSVAVLAGAGFLAYKYVAPSFEGGDEFNQNSKRIRNPYYETQKSS